VFDGGTGNDFLEGGTGDDILIGGDGDDNLEGIDGNDNLDGGAGNDELNGGAGNDSISGGDGIDLIAGNEGNDILLGGAGNDVIVGDEGADTITGGSGIDVIAGGGDSSSDIFRFVDPADGSLVSSNVTKGDIAGDTIGDFETGEDKFQFISSEFGNLSTGTLLGSSFTDLQASNTQYDGTNSGKSGAIFIYDNTNTLYLYPIVSGQ
jgi:Ca2+-binding RTX toxin-like protein